MPSNTTPTAAASFGLDATFLKTHIDVIVLSDATGKAKVAIVPAWQGRVMTSTAGGDEGTSFGWLNRDLIAAHKIQPHINAFGGEDRFWLGPEGGQFSIFFSPGAKFELSDWHTPAGIDTLPYHVVEQTKSSVRFQASFEVSNLSAFKFKLAVDREVRLLSAESVWDHLGLQPSDLVSLVGYESANRITNAGKADWIKETGLLSIWILGMFNPSASTTVVIPIKSGPESNLGSRVTSNYFGEVPAERLSVRESAIFFSGDGGCRSKIGISPQRCKGVLGSYDANQRALTIIQFTQPDGVTEYVNSLWKIHDQPYAGDAANSYNDGPPTPGAKPLGPFYELESSSPAAALRPGESLTHQHRTIHLTGSPEALDPVARRVLGVSLEEISQSLKV